MPGMPPNPFYGNAPLPYYNNPANNFGQAPVIRYANQPEYKNKLKKRRYQERDYGDEDEDDNSGDQVPDSLFSEINLGIIEQQYQLHISGKNKKNQEFLLYESKESICSAVFIGSSKLKITPLDRPGNVYYLAREDSQTNGHFTFKSEVTIFNAIDSKVCESCVKRQGERVGNINISYLC